MNYQVIKDLLSTPKRILLTSHKNPDGDAMGSTLGLQFVLNAMGHSTEVIYPTDYPSFLAWLPGAAQSVTPLPADLKGTEYGRKQVENAEIIFALDFNDLRRIDAIGNWIARSKAHKILIDHHLHPHDFADSVLSDTTASSTCELIYDFVVGIGATHLLDKNAIYCLLTGILTDTGSFAYSTTPKLFRTVAALQEAYQIDFNDLHNQVFNNDSEKRLRLLGYCLTSAMFIFEEFSTAVVILTQSDYHTMDIQRGDTEGIVNFMLRMGNIKFAVLFSDQNNNIKFSFRSKGDFDVQAFSAKHFGGGGHKNASGGESNQGMMKAWVKFRKALEEYPELKA
jgi:bifunctional oligoribonuclease and PAP phosphatase NrnA